MRVVVGISGASGAALGLRVLEVLTEIGAETDLVISTAAERTIAAELGTSGLYRISALATRRHDIRNIGAPIASGSVRTAGMIVAPCSVRTLAAIAHSLSDNLLVRAADVHLKERRPVLLMVRETPLHIGHLRAMMAATEMGVIIMPPAPAFYLKPDSINAAVDQLARRAIDLLNLAPSTAVAWQD